MKLTSVIVMYNFTSCESLGFEFPVLVPSSFPAFRRPDGNSESFAATVARMRCQCPPACRKRIEPCGGRSFSSRGVPCPS